MKWSSSIIFFLILCSQLCAQRQTVTRGSYLPGDTLYFAIDQLPQRINTLSSGEDLDWDFTHLLSPFVRKRIIEPVVNRNLPAELKNADVRIPDADGCYIYYKNGRDAIVMLGREVSLNAHKKVLAFYDPPISLGSALTYNESERYAGTLRTEPFHPRDIGGDIVHGNRKDENLRIIWEVSIEREFDALGIVRLSIGGFDAIREYRETIMIPQLQIFSGGQWKSAPTVRELPEGIRHDHLRQLYFWAEADAEPIVTFEVNKFGNPVKAFFRSARWSGVVVEKFPEQEDIFAYPNPSFGPVRFDLFNLTPGTYQIEIFNILGSKLKSETIQLRGQKTVLMDLADLKKGTYIYRLIDGGRNTIRSKRLVIISP